MTGLEPDNLRRSSTQVYDVNTFHRDSLLLWNAVYATASRGMGEPVRSLTELSFCRFLDHLSWPLDECGPAEARYAILTVWAEDRAAPEPNVVHVRDETVGGA